MINVNSIAKINYKKCYSCRSCEQSCPKFAIQMKEDQEGFLYPYVDSNCVNCGLCLKSCPAYNPVKKNNFRKYSFAAYIKDNDLLSKSTSGGMFAGFAEKIIGDGGVAFGCLFTNDLLVKHSVVEKVEDLYKLKGSKYVASDTGNTYSQVKEYLDLNKKVLYTGTPCQIAGLLQYLKKDYKNLLTVDLICHGVPSQKLFSTYLKWLESKIGGKVIYYGFRDKDVRGCSNNGKIRFIKTGKERQKLIYSDYDPYYSSFIRCESYRESCYTCPYSLSLNRPGDITIGDFMEMKYINPKFDLYSGLSLCIVNTSKGNDFFSGIKSRFNIIPLSFDQYLNIKSNLVSPSVKPSIRNTIYRDINKLPAEKFLKKFKEAHTSYLVYLWFRKIMSKITPKFLKPLIRKFIHSGKLL